MERWQQFQKRVFDQLFRHLGGPDPLQTLADDLGLSRNTLYKRYAGYTPFHIEELIQLSEKYEISLDSQLNQSDNRYEFYFPFSRKSKPDPTAFLSNIARDLDQLIKAGEPSVWYVSDEIPFFQYMHFDLLFAFKLCIWGRLIWSEETGMDRINPVELMDAFRHNQGLNDMREQLLNMYLQIPTIEIWSTPVVDNTVEQIRYLVYTGHLQDRELLEEIISSMEQLTDHVRHQADRGEKFTVNNKISSSSSLELYHNEMTHTNNTILTRCNAGKTIYMTYDNPNYMKCEDEGLCEYTEEWMINLQRQSLLISKTAEKHRVHYFQMIRDKLTQLRKELEL